MHPDPVWRDRLFPEEGFVLIVNSWPVSRHFAVVALVGITALACSKESASVQSDTASVATAPATTDSAANVRGTVSSISATDIVIKSDTGSVTIKLTQPFQVYDRASGKRGRNDCEAA
jgi:hypothetical protein